MILIPEYSSFCWNRSHYLVWVPLFTSCLTQFYFGFPKNNEHQYAERKNGTTLIKENKATSKIQMTFISYLISWPILLWFVCACCTVYSYSLCIYWPSWYGLWNYLQPRKSELNGLDFWSFLGQSCLPRPLGSTLYKVWLSNVAWKISRLLLWISIVLVGWRNYRIMVWWVFNNQFWSREGALMKFNSSIRT